MYCIQSELEIYKLFNVCSACTCIILQFETNSLVQDDRIFGFAMNIE